MPCRGSKVSVSLLGSFIIRTIISLHGMVRMYELAAMTSNDCDSACFKYMYMSSGSNCYVDTQSVSVFQSK